MIRLQGITKKYGNNLIIPKLDLTIYDGEARFSLMTKTLPINRPINVMSIWFFSTTHYSLT